MLHLAWKFACVWAPHSAAAAPPAACATRRADAQGGWRPRVRKELRTLTDVEYKAFITGLATMQAIATAPGRRLYGPKVRPIGLRGHTGMAAGKHAGELQRRVERTRGAQPLPAYIQPPRAQRRAHAGGAAPPSPPLSLPLRGACPCLPAVHQLAGADC